MRDMVTGLEEKGLKFDRSVVDRSPGLHSLGIRRSASSGFSREKGYDLIALTTHGRTGVRRLLLGSVAEEPPAARSRATPRRSARA
jgi:nucleotide-binding universal stress UspA family protein